MGNKKILLGLTTTPRSDWKEKIQEIDKFGIKEISLFLTGIGKEERKDLYNLLEKTKIESIPHVHLRDDMELQEIKYLEKRYHTEAFNIHNKKDPHSSLEFRKYFGHYCLKTFIENTGSVTSEEELDGFGGICIDFSHWKDGILLEYKDYDKEMKKSAKKFCIGCSHISAVGDKIIESADINSKEIKYTNFSKHYLNNLNEVDYIRDFIDYLPNLISLELENSFEEQLKVKEYLEKIIND